MSLFAHLAVRFGSHPENLATEALGYILGRSEAARFGFLNSLGHAARAALPEDLRITTQLATSDAGRPDLAGTDASGQLRLLVEAKFWAGFTEHQPLSYLAQLPPNGALLVVGPAARLPYLERELLRRIDDGGFDRPQLHSSPDFSAGIVDGRHLVLSSWRRTLKAVGTELSSDPASAGDIDQLAALCDRMDTEAFLPITSEELTSRVYRRVYEFGTLVDELVATLVAEGVADTTNLRTSATKESYGRYLRLRGSVVILQVNVLLWTGAAPSPLWLTVLGPRSHETDAAEVTKLLHTTVEQGRPGTVHVDNGRPTVALDVEVGAERHEVAASALRQLRALGDILARLDG